MTVGTGNEGGQTARVPIDSCQHEGEFKVYQNKNVKLTPLLKYEFKWKATYKN